VIKRSGFDRLRGRAGVLGTGPTAATITVVFFVSVFFVVLPANVTAEP